MRRLAGVGAGIATFVIIVAIGGAAGARSGEAVWVIAILLGTLVGALAYGYASVEGLTGRLLATGKVMAESTIRGDRAAGMPFQSIANDSDLRPGQWRVGSVERGLPLVEWRQTGQKLVHQCRIVEADGGLVFVFENPNDASPEIRRRMEQGSFAIGKMILEGARGTLNEGRGGALPWEELDTFQISDEAQAFGHVARPTEGKVAGPPREVLLAIFTGQQRIELSSGFWRSDALATLHGILSKEFVDKRSAHLKRLAAEDRLARNAAAGDREKII